MGLRRQFLTSNWKCIFGDGCQGVLTGPAPELVQGCCSYGAHLIDKKDARRVEKIAKTLTADEWENHGTKKPVIHTNKHGELVTRIKGDACVFLNSPEFGAGAGCALHYAALQRGVNPLTYKPEVCWQLPLRREDQVEEDGHVISTIRQWDRRHWGKGGLEFHWWCTEDPEAFVGTKTRLPRDGGGADRDGRRPRVYKRFLAYIRQRERLRAQRVPLPHPAVRKRSMRTGTGTGIGMERDGNVSGDGSAGADGNGRGNANGTPDAGANVDRQWRRTRPRISQNGLQTPNLAVVDTSRITEPVGRADDLPTRVARGGPTGVAPGRPENAQPAASADTPAAVAQSLSGSSSAYEGDGVDPKIRSYLSSSAKHHEAWTSSGSAPHSTHRAVDSVADRFKLRASSNRRWRPFFTRTPCQPGMEQPRPAPWCGR